MKTVYLAGNIDFVSFSEATDWRKYATKILEDAGFVVLNPTDKYENELSYLEYSSQEIFDKDLELIDKSDILLSTFDEGGFGTPFECGVAWSQNKPIITVAGTKYVNHPFVQSCSEFLSKSLTLALDYLVQNYADN